ncbi:MAG: sensor histidine kinase [Chloroflexota bacterium]
MEQSTLPPAPPWFRWVMPRPIDAVTAFLYLGVLSAYSFLALSGFYKHDYLWLGGGVVLLIVLFLMSLDRLEYWYYDEKLPRRTAFIFLMVRLGLIWAASLGDGLGFLTPPLIILLVPFGVFLAFGGSYGLSGLVWMVYLMARLRIASGLPLSSFWTGDERSLMFLIMVSLMLTFILAMAYLMHQERNNRLRAEKLLSELEASHRQLQNYAARVADLAAAEERNRLAREIHDSLGHYLTVINVQLEKAIAFRPRRPGEADQAVQDAKHLASAALQDVRRSVGSLRQTQEPFSLTQALAELVEHIANDQFSIELAVEGHEEGFSPLSLQTLYRAAQEGLTNIQRHARASRARLQITLAAQTADLSIEDNGQGFDPARLAEQEQNGEHFGLQGVRERVELIRGSLKLVSEPGAGTRLLITVPKNPLDLVQSGDRSNL